MDAEALFDWQMRHQATVKPWGDQWRCSWESDYGTFDYVHGSDPKVALLEAVKEESSYIRCRDCDGTGDFYRGAIEGSSLKCDACNGVGRVKGDN